MNIDTFQEERQFDARYLGQAHEITISVPNDANAETVTEIFREHFKREFGRLDDDRDIEIVNVRLIGRIHLEKPNIEQSKQVKQNGSGILGVRKMYIAGEFIECPVLCRDAIPKHAIAGPLVVEEMTSTLYVPPGWGVSAGALGELNLRPALISNRPPLSFPPATIHPDM